MAKKICWKKGMRLTDEILTASDNSHLEFVSKAMILAAAGRFGLFPSNRSFQVSVSINKNIVDIESLDCLAITKGGDLIDVMYDTKFTNTFDTRALIPNTEEKSLYLTVSIQQNEWRDTNDGYCEPIYSFDFISENTALAENAFPIARLVNEYGWRIDDIDFVPPCLYLSSHPSFESLANQFIDILKSTSICLRDSLTSDCKVAISIFWPIVQQLRITMDKEIDLMTPMILFGHMQKFISGFLCGCQMDSSLNLTEEYTLENYINLPYNYKDIYNRIKEGLNLCLSVKEKVEKFKGFSTIENKIEAPTISKSNLVKRCTNSKVRIPVENNCPEATVYYTIDGSEPTNTSNTGNTIVVVTGFVGGREKEEKDKVVVVKVKAMLNGISSNTNTYKITLQKDIKHWIEI